MLKVYLKIGLIVNKFWTEHGNERTVKLLIESSYLFDAMVTLYDYWKVSEITPIEQIEQIRKHQFWDEAGKYIFDKDKRIKGAKVLYVLELLTKFN